MGSTKITRILNQDISQDTKKQTACMRISSGVLRDSQDPRHKAELWDAYLLRYPEKFPELAEEVRKK